MILKVNWLTVISWAIVYKEYLGFKLFVVIESGDLFKAEGDSKDSIISIQR